MLMHSQWIVTKQPNSDYYTFKNNDRFLAPKHVAADGIALIGRAAEQRFAIRKVPGIHLYKCEVS